MAGLVFVTGATGFIGGVVVKKALESGYKLRLAVRKEAQVDEIKQHFSKHADAIEFVVVPDITVPGAYAGKLDGVESIIHMASPLVQGTDKAAVFPPAINGTLEILREAKKTPSVKKVIITSSIATFVPVKAHLPPNSVISESHEWDVNITEDDDLTGDSDAATAFTIYHASKILADKASWDFLEKEKPGFTLIGLHPSFVYGYNDRQKTAEEVKNGTNGMLWGGIMAEGAAGAFGSVNVEDVADGHVKALDPRINRSTKYLLAGPNATWDDVLDIVEADYPHIPYKLKRGPKGLVFTTNTEKAQKELGIKFKDLRTTVHEVVDQQLGFLSGK